jgi:hypothetical protein
MSTELLDEAINGFISTNDGGSDDADASIDETIEGKTGESEDKEKKPAESGEQDGETDGNDDDLDDSDVTDEVIDEDDKTQKQDQQPKPKKNRFQERIDYKTQENRELRQKLEELEAQIESKPPELPPAPDPNKYTFDKRIKGDFERAQAKYYQDVGKWEAQCETVKSEHEGRGTQRVQKEQQRYFSKMASEKSFYGDYDTAVRTLGSFKMTPELHEALSHDDNNTDLFCFLGNPKHHSIAEEVFSMKGYSQARKLAEISFKLQAAKARQKAKPSGSKPPVSKPKGGKGGSGGLDFEKMNDADYLKLMGKAKAKIGKF